ncbi:MAG: hypothetical protein C4527_02670 [Candidatus Omnitrophota bacterium]|jgi:citrate synthase|nr:MAG: hypothetical protein C4527_02670 [Candidatus Omnitrophota bacterium]
MVSGPTSVNSSPVIRFRPDPGEPAVRLAAPPEQTALLVASQEQRNETRLRSRAIARGEDVIFSKRTFTLGIDSSSPVYNGGLTTVVSRPDANGFLPDQVLQPIIKEQGVAPGETEKEDDESPLDTESLLAQADQPTEEEIEQEKQELENEDSRLNQNLTRAILEQNRALENDDAVQFEQARRKQSQVAREMEENERDLREVELEELKTKMEEFQQSADDALQDNIGIAAGILDVMFGWSREPSAARVF